jgi:hypothetical protein
MIEKFLKAKHWQIFIITIGIQAIIQAKFIPVLIRLDDPRIILITVPLMILFSITGFFLYFWSTGVGIQAILPNDLKIKIKGFKIKFFYLVIYLILFSFIGVISFLGLFDNYFAMRGGFVFGPQMIFVPFHLFAVYSFFSILFFISKLIMTSKHNEKAQFYKSFGTFILMCLYPIGIWIIQPMINKLTEKK